MKPKIGTWFIILFSVAMNALCAQGALSLKEKEAIAEAIFRYEMARCVHLEKNDPFTKKLSCSGSFGLIIENHDISYALKAKLSNDFPLVFDPSNARERIAIDTIEFFDKSKVKVSGSIIYGFVTKYSATTIYYELDKIDGAWQVKHGYVRDRSTWEDFMNF